MRPLRALFLLALTSACTVTEPGTYGPPRDFRPAEAEAIEVAAENVAALDPVGTSIEASIASVPGNTTHLAANVAKIRPRQRARLEAYYSTDAGATWTASAPMPMTATNGREYDGQGDAVMAADRAGRFYSAMLTTKGAGPYEYSSVAVSRSDDGGKTWGSPVVLVESPWVNGVGPFNDKEWIAVDNSGGPRDGTIYVVWQQMEKLLIGVPSAFYISRSTDQGRTWSAPRATSAAEAGGAMMIEIGPEGEVYIGRWSMGRGGYIAQVSKDGGETFSAPVLIATGGQAPQAPPSRYFAFPRLHADRSFGAHRGKVYFVSSISATASNGRRVAAAGIAVSADGGKTWSRLRTIVAPGDGDALFPMGIVNDATGEVVVAWLDRREDSTGRTARVYASRSRDGGATFEPALAFSPPFSVDAQWLGEYYGVAVSGSHYVATYSDAAGRLFSATMNFDPPRTRRRAVRR